MPDKNLTRREAILKAAIELFAHRGYHATPTAAIARAAGVAEGTIFHHFHSKEGLLAEIFTQLVENYLGELEEAAGATNPGLLAIEMAIRAHYRFTDRRSQDLLLILNAPPLSLHQPGSITAEIAARGTGRLLERLTAALKQGQDDGSIRSDIDSRKTAHIIHSLLHGAARHQLLGPVPVPYEADDVVAFCLESLRG